jgi:hypothetical protein
MYIENSSGESVTGKQGECRERNKFKNGEMRKKGANLRSMIAGLRARMGSSCNLLMGSETKEIKALKANK